MTEELPSPAAMSEPARLVGIFWEPKPVFENLALKPRFWSPLILLTVLAVLYSAAIARFVGWEEVVTRQLESNERMQQLPAEQRERIIEQSLRLTVPLGYAGAALGTTMSALLIAAVVLGMTNLFGGAALKFKQAFSLTCYSMLPMGLATVLSMVVLFLKDPADFDIRRPLPLNLGVLPGVADAPAGWRTLAESIDLFSIWVIVLLALGFSSASRRLSFSKALVLILVPWLAVVLVRSALAGLSG